MRMKRVLCTALTAALLFTSTGLTALAAEATITANTRVYQRASTSSRSIKVKKGMKVELISADGSWSLIENTGNGVKAYVKTKYVKAVEEEKKDETNFGELMFFAKEAYITADTRVYQRASTSSKSIKVKKGMRVNHLRTQDGWAIIERDGVYAYIKPKYVSTDLPATEPSEAMQDAREAVIIADAPVYEDFEREGRSIKVKKGMKVNLLGTQKGISVIENKGTIGYINESYVVTLAPDGTREDWQSLWINDDDIANAKNCTMNADAKMYTFDRENSSYIIVPKGTRVKVLDENDSNNTYLIAKAGAYGYLYGYVTQDAIDAD